MSSFRASRFRNVDLLRLILLHFPLRCLICGERTYRFLGKYRVQPVKTTTTHN